MDLNLAREALDQISALLTTVKGNLTADVPGPVTTLVKAGDNLQAALNKGGVVELEAAANFEGTYTLNAVSLIGRPGSAIRGKSDPALIAKIGTADITVSNVEVTSGHPEVIRLGDNGWGVNAIQTKVEHAPDRITFVNVRTPSHRGKTVYTIHARHVSLINCEALETWSPAGQDSCAIYIGNTPGPVTVKGGRYSAGSMAVLSGGDTMRIPDVCPTGLLFEDVELFRPLSWQTDGVGRKVTNLIEIKNGRDVILRRSNLHGCWANGQQGEAIMLTPALDGSRTVPPLHSGEVHNVLVEDVRISDCSTVVNILGRAYSAYTNDATSGVVFRRVKATVSSAQFGGRGQLATIGGEPNDVTFDDVTYTSDGSSLIYYYHGDVLDPATRLSRLGGKLGTLTLTNSRCTLGAYGLFLGGYSNAVNWQQSVGALTVTGNVFGGATTMQRTLPDNQYLDRATFDVVGPQANIVWGT